MREVGEQLLWQDVEKAERLLLCGAFQGAQATAASVLARASAERNGATSAHDDIIESSAMVLLQAQHELGKHQELENQFLKVFSKLDAMPHDVFLMWSCLRVKAGDIDGAEAAVLEFLASKSRQLDRRSSCCLAGLYALDILCDHRQTPNQAENWLHKQAGWLDAATMKLLLRKVKRRQQRAVSASACPDRKNAHALSSKVTDSSNTQPSERPPIHPSFSTALPDPPNGSAANASVPSNSVEPRVVSNPAVTQEDSSSRLDSQSDPGPSNKSWVSWLLYWAAFVHGWWRQSWQNGDQKWGKIGGGRALLMVLAAGVFLYAVAKERAALRRHLQKVTGAFQQTLADLFELAFSYSLNPLAAAAQLSPPTMPRT